MPRVRFLRAKRYPHPDGPKRHAGEQLDVPQDLADAWMRGGLVELAPAPSTPASETKPAPQVRPAPVRGKPAARKRRR